MSSSAIGEYRIDPSLIQSIANAEPRPNFDRSNGNLMTSWGSRTTATGSSPLRTDSIAPLNIRRQATTPTSLLVIFSFTRSAMGPWVTQAMTS